MIFMMMMIASATARTMDAINDGLKAALSLP